MADTANIVYRDFVTYGVPSSGKNKPKKDEIRRLLTGYEAIINAFTSNGGLIYSSKAVMDADLARPANSMAWVLGDATVANNGIYRKVGGVGTGSWTRAGDLPFSFIIANDVGAGTANDIQVTTSIPVSASALVWMNIFEANTAAPVTVSFNGGAPLTIKTNTGNNVAAGGLVSGMIVLGVVSGSTFRLINDQVSSAIVAAAEAAQAAAELARDQAQAAAAAAADKTPLALFYQARKVAPDKKARDAVNAYAWVSAASPADNNWLSICWSPDLHLFVAVAGTGTGNRVMTSPDGATWTLRTSPVDNSWISVCWSPELRLFVAVASSGTGNRVMTSPDGINWTARTTPADNDWLSVCWSPELSLFVATAITGTGNRVMTSPDGITWTLRTSPADNSWRSVCWSPELKLFVAVAGSGTGNRAMTSPDGITWTLRTSAADNDWRSVCWSSELRLLVAVSSSGTGNRVMTSPDGINWTARTSASDNDWRSVCWSPDLGEFIAVAGSGTGNRLMLSSDGISWSATTSAADNDWRSVCWSPALKMFVSVSISGTGNRVMTSISGYRSTDVILGATYLKIASKGYVDLKTDFGAPGVADDYTTPWGSFLNACLFDSKKGKIPNGTFNVSAPVTLTCTAPFQSIAIEGTGRQTLLNFRGELTAALTLNYQTVFNSFNLAHLNVQTDSETTAMSAFRLISPAYGDPAAAEYNIFKDVVFKGLDGYKVSDHWKTAVYGYRTNNLVFDNCRFIGPGTPIGDPNGRGNLIELQSATGDYCVKHTFNNCFFSQFENAILVGEYVQGIVVNGSDFVGGRCGVYVPAGQHANDGLLVTGGHMNTRVAGIEVLSTEATSMEVANTFFIIDKVNQVGIRTAGYRWSVTNTHFQGQGTVTGAAGVQAISGSHHGIITANQYGFMPSGNVLNSGSHDILVVNNRYESVTTPNVNNGTNNTIGAATP
ncbi:WD40 repeat domain-containing protein [Ensifer sp. ZNC0028]|uniref:WD40 repeat domain-containing protein n=1 Tax=Ensifer sp. ZNC0028 TaxID=1339236 RepID=UPI00069021D4|nr:WD40 repeat domain-containing protein [Ensifer sp. ZNC0028]